MRNIARATRAGIGHIGGLLAKPMDRMQRNWTRFLGDARGNLTVMLGFCAIGLVGAVGIAIDTSVAYNVRSQLAAAVDAAALAGARNFASPNRDTDIQNFFTANFQEGYMGSVLQPLEIASDNEARTVTVTARVTIPTFFMSVLGTDSTDISATAEATLSSRDVEVSLVLDVTGSMGGSKITDLKAAAKELIGIVVQDQQDPFYTKVALVPYSSSVNVGSYADQIRGTLTTGTCVYPAAPTCTVFEYPDASSPWSTVTGNATTCVTERPGVHISDDAAPSLAPLGPHFDRGNACVNAEIMPLSSDKQALNDAVDALTTGGYTAGHLGAAWGWYMISPNFGYLWPAESQPMNYGELHLGRKVLKVVVLMTDGEFNTFYVDGVVAKNSNGSISSSNRIDENGTNGNSFDQAEALCTAMKAEGVEVYTVGFAVGAASSEATFLRNCATTVDHFYLPSSGTDLKQAFRDIATQISNLRISM